MKQTRHFKLPLAAALIAMGVVTGTAYGEEPQVGSEPEHELNLTTDAAHPSGEPTNGVSDFCFLTGLPPSDQKYRVIEKLKVGKGTYGSVKDLQVKVAKYAQSRGADAIIEYTGSQRFGFWPWRMVRPVVRGTAVEWAGPKPADCESIGGTKLRTILSSGQTPTQ